METLVPIPSLAHPLLCRGVSRLVAHPSSADPSATAVGLDAFRAIGGNAIYLHGEGGETETRRATARWLGERGLRDAFTLAVSIAHDEWDESRQRPIDRFNAAGIHDDVRSNLSLLDTRLDLACVGDQPHSPFEPVLDALARERDAGRIHGVILSNWSSSRLGEAIDHAHRFGGPPVTGILTSEAAAFTATEPLWPEYTPYASVEGLVTRHDLLVLAHADDLNIGQCLFGDESETARLRPEWVRRWSTGENRRMAERLSALATATGRSCRALNLAAVLTKSPLLSLIVPLPAMIDGRRDDYLDAAARPLTEHELNPLRSGSSGEPHESLRIRVDDVSGEAICALIRAHLARMHKQSPPESVHALGIERLRDKSITVWSAWSGDEIAGIGALKAMDEYNGEVKSMRTRDAFLRRGVASSLLRTIIAEARSRGYGRLWLETGGTDDFAAARQLYERFGFENCGPFGDYVFDPFSRYMTLKLD